MQAVWAAQESPDGFIVVFSEEIPQCDVDACDGFECETLGVGSEAHG